MKEAEVLLLSGHWFPFRTRLFSTCWFAAQLIRLYVMCRQSLAYMQQGPTSIIFLIYVLSLSYTLTIQFGYDAPLFVSILANGNGCKKENPISIRCLTMLLRCQHILSTDILRFMMAALKFTTAELRMLTMRPRFDTVLVRFKPLTPRPPPRTVFVMIRDESGWTG